MTQDPNAVVGPTGTPEQPPVTQAAPETGHPQETVEQLQARKAYFQTKAQEETEARKAEAQRSAQLEADLKATREKLAQRDPQAFAQQMTDFGIDQPAQPRNAQGQFVAAQPQTGYDPNDPETWIDATANKVLTALEQKEAQRAQAQESAAYQASLQVANQSYNEVVVKHKIAPELAQEAVSYAKHFVPGRKPGDPERRAMLALDYITANMRVSYGTQIETVQAAADQKRVELAATLAQPAAAAPGVSAPIDPHKTYRDAIAPDDPPIG